MKNILWKQITAEEYEKIVVQANEDPNMYHGWSTMCEPAMHGVYNTTSNIPIARSWYGIEEYFQAAP